MNAPLRLLCSREEVGGMALPLQSQSQSPRRHAGSAGREPNVTAGEEEGERKGEGEQRDRHSSAVACSNAPGRPQALPLQRSKVRRGAERANAKDSTLSHPRSERHLLHPSSILYECTCSCMDSGAALLGLSPRLQRADSASRETAAV